MKKVTSQYMYGDKFIITVNEEVRDYISIHEFGEPCSGIIKHWGSARSLIQELEEAIDAIRETLLVEPIIPITDKKK